MNSASSSMRSPKSGDPSGSTPTPQRKAHKDNDDLLLGSNGEPFEVYGTTSAVGIIDNGIEYPVLVGCYKSQKHLEWIQK